MYYYLTALTIGLMGSLHCVGMCGPIAMAVPLNSTNENYRWLGTFNYLIGKSITYSLLGLFSGALAKMIEITGFQRYISLFTGVLILVIFIVQHISKGNSHFEKLNYNWVGLLKKQFNNFIQKKNLISALLIGIVNGLLPCGLVYLALAGAVGAGGWWQSMIYMFLFGLGTMPLLVGIMIFKNKLSISYQRIFKSIVPGFTLTLAILLIVRGLNLGIPYFSPRVVETKDKHVIQCCVNPKVIEK
jgi:hypothetical protein